MPTISTPVMLTADDIPLCLTVPLIIYSPVLGHATCHNINPHIGEVALSGELPCLWATEVIEAILRPTDVICFLSQQALLWLLTEL